MRFPVLQNASRYGIPLLTVSLATLCTTLLHRATGEEALFFFAAVTISTLYGGLVAGLISIGLSVLAIDYFFAQPIGNLALTLYNVPLLAVFISLALLISYWVELDRRKEDQLRRANAELEQRVSERTSELVKANRVKDEFVATVSHDLGQPLTSILGWLDVIESHPNDPESVSRALKVLRRSTEEQAQLVRDLIDVSGIACGGLSFRFRPVDLASVIESAVERLLPIATAKQIDIELMLDKTTAPISGDSDRLLQLVSNLLGNALKFTPPGGRIIVQLASVGSELELSVADNGQGIDPEFIPYVFEPFRRGATARRSSGLGLGLAIVKHIGESHGGRVTAQSEGEGTGCKFIVTIPA